MVISREYDVKLRDVYFVIAGSDVEVVVYYFISGQILLKYGAQKWWYPFGTNVIYIRR